MNDNRDYPLLSYTGWHDVMMRHRDLDPAGLQMAAANRRHREKRCIRTFCILPNVLLCEEIHHDRLLFIHQNEMA